MKSNKNKVSNEPTSGKNVEPQDTNHSVTATRRMKTRIFLMLKNQILTFFVSFIAPTLAERTLTIAKTCKKVHVQSSRVFIPEKGRLDTGIQNGSTETFAMIFFGYLTKHVVLYIFLLNLCSFVPEKSHVHPKNVVFGMGWTWVARFTWAKSWS